MRLHRKLDKMIEFKMQIFALRDHEFMVEIETIAINNVLISSRFLIEFHLNKHINHQIVPG